MLLNGMVIDMSKSMKNILNEWKEYISLSELQSKEEYLRKQRIRDRKKAKEREINPIKSIQDDFKSMASGITEDEEDLEEANPCGNRAHGMDGKFANPAETDGSYTNPKKSECDNGRQYSRKGLKRGTYLSPCGRRNRKRKCSG